MTSTRASFPEYQALFAASLDAIMITTTDGRILAANPAACRILGRDEEDIRRLGRWGLVDRDDPAVAQALETRARTGSFEGELTFHRKNGESFPAEVSTATFADGAQAGKTVMIFRDITERKRIAESLRLSEEKFGRLFYMSPDGITVTRRSDGRYQEVNPGFTLTSGYEPDEVLGHTPIELGIWTSAEQRERFVLELEVKGQVLNGEFDFRFKGGRIRTCLVSARPLEIGGVPCILSTTRDITERKHMEEALLRTQKLESVGLLAGGIAHDFNNMLGGLMGFLELAKEMDRQGHHERVSGYLEKALGIFPKARGLTHQLLTFSKGGNPIRRTLALGPLVRTSATFALSGSNVVGEFHLPDQLWPCDCDETQISQAVDNVVLNAIQAMPLGGVLTVGARNVTQVMGRIGRFVEVTVTDQGPGIQSENLNKIFDPFFTTKPAGRGLGLATVFSILRKHGGWVDVTSVPGSGATFHLYLPASTDPLTTAASAAECVHRGEGLFLVMDDNEAILEVSTEWLMSMGYQVHTCRDGDEAVRLIARANQQGHPYRAALLDLTVPGKQGGLETARLLRNSDHSLVLFASSGYSEDPIVANPGDFGFMGTMVKPFQKKDLCVLLSSVLSSCDTPDNS